MTGTIWFNAPSIYVYAAPFATNYSRYNGSLYNTLTTYTRYLQAIHPRYYTILYIYINNKDEG